MLNGFESYNNINATKFITKNILKIRDAFTSKTIDRDPGDYQHITRVYLQPYSLQKNPRMSSQKFLI